MKRLRIAATALAIIFSVAPVSAQTSAPPDVVAVSIWPTIAVVLPEKPVAASFSLGQIEGVAPQLITGVTAKGFARKVAVDNQSYGQVLVMSVAKGDREETISTEGMTAQFDAKETSQLFPEKTLEVKGSKSALVAALERLSKPKANAETPKTEKDGVQNNQTSNGKSSNDLASAYKSPTISTTPISEPAATPDPVVENRTATEGCPMRIDAAQGVAVQQSKLQTFTDGALTTDGACTDSDLKYPLKKSYSACPADIVDLTALQAWPQYALYYTDSAAENHTVSDCAKDVESAFTITEDEGQCSILQDFTARTATPQAALIYTNHNNAIVQARGCAASTKSAVITMTQSTSNCSLRHDYTAGLSYEKSMWTYTRNGVAYQAAPCADTGRSFAQEAVYADASANYICTPITNLTTKKVTLQSRKRINIDGAYQYITECTPDTAASSILSTTDGCMDPSKWSHDLEGSVSHGQERFYYLKTDASRSYVTDCQTSTTAYPHSVTITGYQPHDDQLWAYPLTTVTISVSDSPYTVASSEVLPGAPQLVYLPNGTVDQATGQSTYDVCNAYRATARYERWQRPDASEYLKQVGTGPPTGPVNICVTTQVGSQQVQIKYGAHDCYTVMEPDYFACSMGVYYQTVTKTETKNTETGAILASSCAIPSPSIGAWGDAADQIKYRSYGCNWNGYGNMAFCTSTQILVSNPPNPCPF